MNHFEAVVLVLKRLRGDGFVKVTSDRLGEPGIALGTPGYKVSDLSSTSLYIQQFLIFEMIARLKR